MAPAEERAVVGLACCQRALDTDLSCAKSKCFTGDSDEAHGQAPGSAVDALGRMNLVDGPEPGTTTMLWAAEVSISGMIASVGARLVEGTANKMIGQAFDCIRAKIVAER